MYFDRLRNDFRRWRECRRSAAELSKLTPRQLEDIGLAPYEIEDAARGRLRRQASSRPGGLGAGPSPRTGPGTGPRHGAITA